MYLMYITQHDAINVTLKFVFIRYCHNLAEEEKKRKLFGKWNKNKAQMKFKLDISTLLLLRSPIPSTKGHVIFCTFPFWCKLASNHHMKFTWSREWKRKRNNNSSKKNNNNKMEKLAKKAHKNIISLMIYVIPLDKPNKHKPNQTNNIDKFPLTLSKRVPSSRS